MTTREEAVTDLEHALKQARTAHETLVNLEHKSVRTQGAVTDALAAVASLEKALWKITSEVAKEGSPS